MKREARPGRIRGAKHEFLIVAAGASCSALLRLGVLALAGRQLGPEGYAGFAVLWGGFYALAGFLSGIQQETARSVSADDGKERPRQAPPIGGSLGLGALTAGGVLLTSWIWIPSGEGLESVLTSIVLALGVLSLTLYVSLCGSLAGISAWRSLAYLVVGEALLRLLVAPVVLSANHGVVAQTVVVTVGPLAAAAALSLSHARRALTVPGSTTTSGHVRRCFQAGATTGSSALLISGFPLLILLTSPATLEPESGVLFAAITLTRPCCLFPLNGVRLRLVTWITAAHPTPSVRFVRRATLAVLGVAGGVALMTGLLGAPVLRATFGNDFDLAPLTMAALGATAVLTGVLTVTGVALVAADRHMASMVGWLLAVAAASVVFAMPLDLEPRCVLGLAIGPVVGIAFHGYAFARSRSRA